MIVRRTSLSFIIKKSQSYRSPFGKETNMATDVLPCVAHALASTLEMFEMNHIVGPLIKLSLTSEKETAELLNRAETRAH